MSTNREAMELAEMTADLSGEMRRDTAVALIVLHTAEVEPNYSLPTCSTEVRAGESADPPVNAGPWHATVDAHSVRHGLPSDRIVSHVRGWNSRTIGLGLVTRHDLWDRMPAEHTNRLVENAARVAARYCKLHDIPVELVATFEEARSGRRGLIAHSTLDPARHRDPGPGFPWPEFVERVRLLAGAELIVGRGDRGTQVSDVQCRLTDLGYGDLVGPIDGVAGPRFDSAVRAYEVERGLAATGLWSPPIDLDAPPTVRPSRPAGAPVTVSAGVGNGSDDRPDDRRAIMQRLDALGFMRPGRGLDHCLRLFQAAVAGADSLRLVTGRVDPASVTLDWMNAVNAPRWVRVPEGSDTEGFRSRQQFRSDDDQWWATDWLVDTLRGAATIFQLDHLTRYPEARPIRVLGVASMGGGDQARNGLSLELELASSSASARELTVDAPGYDRDATRAIIKAFWRHGGIDAVYLNDTVLSAEGLCQRGSTRDDRVMVAIRPPERLG